MTALPELPRLGRLPDNPAGCVDETFVLWPTHFDLIERWAQHHDCSQSAALRLLIEVATKASPSPGSAAAKEASARIAKVQDKIREKAINERSKLSDLRRQRRNESSRLSRARRKGMAEVR